MQQSYEGQANGKIQQHMKQCNMRPCFKVNKQADIRRLLLAWLRHCYRHFNGGFS